ncbi:SAM-dependent methyltransferase [Pseudonocardia phyllosphaerae]|uniref:SAM-dependent methyltransferase n=1 Tax=Pseudonocardia phyllosphaerae TaxID=3390502 RepID=UPI00397CD550
MPPALSPRICRILDILPIEPTSRVLEIGCGPGVAARAIAEQLTTGFVLAVDRSPTAIAQLERTGAALVASGRLAGRVSSAEDLVLAPEDAPFDLAFANRVGALDGRHPEREAGALRAISRVLVPGGLLYVDGRPCSCRPV